MTSKDLWHYPRQDLAEQVLGMFDSGLSSALVFFAPRRMGKTEFLLKDIKPTASKQHWSVLYFSFLDATANATEAFTLALLEFATEIGSLKSEKLRNRIKKISVGAIGIQAGIEFKDSRQSQLALKEIMSELAKHNKKILLLLDEIQILSHNEKNREFIAALRTFLDINKDNVKVIFTGSSREGLRHMFSKSDAPFFHFGQNLPFPEFEKNFIEHLSKVFYKATSRNIDTQKLWEIFVELGKIPQLIRSLVERLILHPNITLTQAKNELLEDITQDREYVSIWENITLLEQLILKTIVLDEKAIFSENMRSKFAKTMGIDTLQVSTLQSSIRSLQKKNIIVSSTERGIYYVDDPNFKSWIKRTIIET